MHGAIGMVRKRRRLAVGGDRDMRRLDFLPTTVDDPENGEKITVLRSLRIDPLAALHARRQIDEAEYYAGRHWQRAYELAELGGSRAIDPTREAVDGGKYPEPLSDIQARAFNELATASKALGMEGESIVKDVLARGMPILHVAAARGLTTERELLYIGKRFRECLNTLAVTFGYAMKGTG